MPLSEPLVTTKFCLKFRIQSGYIALNFFFSHVKAWGGPHVTRLSALASPLNPPTWWAGGSLACASFRITPTGPPSKTPIKRQNHAFPSAALDASLSSLRLRGQRKAWEVFAQRRGCSFPRSRARAPPPRPRGFLGEPFQPHPGSGGNARQRAR